MMIASETQFFLTRAAAMKERHVSEEVAGQKTKFQFSSITTYGFPTYA